MITTTSALAEACAHLARFDFVTVDTEFLRESTFWPKLCVVQLASPEQVFVVDALAPGLDLAPFIELMRNEGITERIERMAVERASSAQIAVAAREEGMQTLRQDGLAKALAGVTSLDEVLRVVV